MSTLAGVLLLVTIVGGLIALAFSPKVNKWMRKMMSPYEEGETFDGESARRAPRLSIRGRSCESNSCWIITRPRPSRSAWMKKKETDTYT